MFIMQLKFIRRHDGALHEWISSATVGENEMGANERQNAQIKQFKASLGNVCPTANDGNTRQEAATSAYLAMPFREKLFLHHLCFKRQKVP